MRRDFKRGLPLDPGGNQIFIRPFATARSAAARNDAELIFRAVGRTPGGFVTNQPSIGDSRTGRTGVNAGHTAISSVAVCNPVTHPNAAVST